MQSTLAVINTLDDQNLFSTLDRKPTSHSSSRKRDSLLVENRDLYHS